MYNNNYYYIIMVLLVLLLYFFDLFLACVVSMERTYARPDINDKKLVPEQFNTIQPRGKISLTYTAYARKNAEEPFGDYLPHLYGALAHIFRESKLWYQRPSKLSYGLYLG